ncbi:hypothetical protein D3C80_1804260 [compost metagenome]
MDLQRIGADLFGDVARVHLGHRRLARAVDAGLGQACSVQAVLERGLDAGRHVRQVERHPLQLVDRRAVGLALAGIGGRRLQRATSRAGGNEGNADAAVRQ